MKENEKKNLKHEKLFVKMYTFFQIKPKLSTNVLQIHMDMEICMDNQLVSIF